MRPLIAIVLAYVVGSIPSAHIAGKACGIDLREHGSGNLGATNVIRVLGAKIGALVFAADVAKGAFAVAVLGRWFALADYGPAAGVWTQGIPIICGLVAIAGHVRPVFLKFGRGGGGKGVATSAGVFLALAPVPAIVGLVTFAVVLYVSGYVSLGSLAGATALPVALLAWQGASPLFFVSLLITVFVFWTHRANIRRLRRGEEHRFRHRPAGTDDVRGK